MKVTQKISAALFAGLGLALLGGVAVPSAQAQLPTEHERQIRQKSAEQAKIQRQEEAARHRPGYNAAYWTALERRKADYWDRQIARYDKGQLQQDATEDARQKRQRDGDFKQLFQRRDADLARTDRQEAAAKHHPNYNAAYWAFERKKKQVYYGEQEAQKKKYWNAHN